jgi:hydrogenase expression/formation protein HypC
MCLAIPMKIVDIEGHNAGCEAKGIRRRVSLYLLSDQGIEVGDHVLVHVGYAIQKVTAQEAHTTWDLFDEVIATLDLAHA